MKLLLLAISVVYVFDAAVAPVMHLPLWFLTLVYFGSCAEVLIWSRVYRYAKRRFFSR